jgi:tagatose 1,6-diphosphate aldolase
MKLEISAGKRRGLRAVADSRGIIAAVAIDQRSALRSLFAKAMDADLDRVPAEMLIQFKEAVSSVLTPHASAILLDPEYGLPASRRRAKGCGLLLAYEMTGYDKAVPGRLPRLLDQWSVRRLINEGADSIKVLLYYSSFSARETNDRKHAFVERIGAECAAADVPFFLELVSYADGMEEKPIEFAKAKAELVTEGMVEFSKQQYRVDMLKVGFPVKLAYVEGSPSAVRETLHTREEAKRHFLSASDSSSVPFLFLSEGVSNETFQFGLELAVESGARFSGVLCGRATWKDGVPVFVEKGSSGLQEWLETEGVRNIAKINAHLKAATPWHAFRTAALTDAPSK